jgi:hypothetical protein
MIWRGSLFGEELVENNVSEPESMEVIMPYGTFLSNGCRKSSPNAQKLPTFHVPIHLCTLEIRLPLAA